MYGKTKVRIYRIIGILIVVCFIIIPIFVKIFPPKAKLIGKNFSVTYYESLDSTTCDITLTFNRSVKWGSATISFYGQTGNFLSTEEVSFYHSYGNIAENTFTSVSGNVKSFDVVSYDFDAESHFEWLAYLIPFTALIALLFFMVSCKECSFGEYKINVYAGFYHHTLWVNDEKCDEHNTIASYSPITLSTTTSDGTLVEVTISLSNRITVKANGKLVQ